MGMFDTVKYKANCWKCKEPMTDFQTKDAGMNLSIVNPKQIGTGRFYGTCYKCHAWNEYDVIPKEIEIIFNEKESKINTVD